MLGTSHPALRTALATCPAPTFMPAVPHIDREMKLFATAFFGCLRLLDLLVP